MDMTDRLAARLTHRLRHLRATQESFTIDLGDVYVQAASYEGDAVLIEFTGDEFLPEDRRLSGVQHDELLRLGFNRPGDVSPNWWIGIEDGNERSLYAAARAAVTALTEFHGVPADAWDEELPLYRWTSEVPQTAEPRTTPASGIGEPLTMETTLGSVTLFANGFATFNGEPWDDRPVREWYPTKDGRLAVTLAVPRGEYFLNVGFVPETDANAELLRSYVPSRDELTSLAQRLAVHEQYALTCIETGTMVHYVLASAASRLSDAEGARKASEIVGWDLAPRLAAAEAAVDAFWRRKTADNNREQQHDEEKTWQAIQAWVRISPWKDDFDFEVIPTPPRPWAIASPEVEIQRIYR